MEHPHENYYYSTAHQMKNNPDFVKIKYKNLNHGNPRHVIMFLIMTIVWLVRVNTVIL